jgi:hypothetical protein
LGWFGTNWNKVWTGIKNFFVNIWNSTTSFFSSVLSGWVNRVRNNFNTIKSVATSVWNGVKNAIMKPINAARDGVKRAIDAIKGFFSRLKLKLPHIKLPHFKIKGDFSLNPPSVPKLSIDWYKNGGIFTKPTIFNTPYGMKGVGEAGAEAVLPIDLLQRYISGAIARTVQNVNLNSLADAIEDLANRPVVLNINDRQFALATASASDSVSGMRTRFVDRGMILD